MSLLPSLVKPLGAWREETPTVEDVPWTADGGLWTWQEISLALFERWGSLREEARVDG